MLRKTLLAAAVALCATAAHADPLYWSLGVGTPGVSAQLGNVYAPPVYVAPPPPVVYYPSYAPAYGWGYAPRWHHDDDHHWRRWHHRDDDDD